VQIVIGLELLIEVKRDRRLKIFMIKLLNKVIFCRKSHMYSVASCPFTGYTYSTCTRCGDKTIEKTVKYEFR